MGQLKIQTNSSINRNFISSNLLGEFYEIRFIRLVLHRGRVKNKIGKVVLIYQLNI